MKIGDSGTHYLLHKERDGSCKSDQAGTGKVGSLRFVRAFSYLEVARYPHKYVLALDDTYLLD